jgi:hypothetical protein
MPFVPPTPAEFKARYPEFDALVNARIEGVLDEVVLDVGEDWPEEFRKPAMMALTGHLLAQEGALRSDQTAGGSTASQVVSVKVGDVSTNFADVSTGDGSASGIYETTAYGRRFLDLKRLAFGNPRPAWEWA